MKHIMVFTLLLMLCSCAKSQENATRLITTKKSEKHIKNAGTNVYIIPPPGFDLNATGESLVNLSTASRISVSQLATPFDPHNAKTSNTKVERVQINQYQGVHTSNWKSKDLLQEYLEFGNKNVSVTVVADILATDTASLNNIQTSLYSVVLTDEAIPDPADDAVFKVDVKNTSLKFTRFFNGMLIYSETGSMLSESRFGFIVAFKYAMIAESARQKQVAENYLREELYYHDVKIKENNIITIDGLSGCAVTAEGNHTDSNTHDIIYLVVLYVKNGAYVMLGTSSEDYANKLAMFKRVANTFHLKIEDQ